MGELKAIKARTQPSDTLLVVDAMTGQEAAQLTKAFDEAVDVTGAQPPCRGLLAHCATCSRATCPRLQPTCRGLLALWLQRAEWPWPAAVRSAEVCGVQGRS